MYKTANLGDILTLYYLCNMWYHENLNLALFYLHYLMFARQFSNFLYSQSKYWVPYEVH